MGFEKPKVKGIKQYCRYCSYMCCGDANWCSKHQKCLSDSTIKTTNHCKDFNLNPIDALFENEKGYQPRLPYSERKEKPKYKQLSLFGDEV